MKFEWRGLIAAILAAGLSFSLVVGVAGAVWQGRPVTEKGGEVLVGIFVAMAAAVTAYIATTNHRNGDKK